MSVRSETLTRSTRRIPIVTIVAAVLAFSVGIALGATLLGDDAGTTERQTTLVVPATNPSDAGAARLESREATLGTRPIPVAEPSGVENPGSRTESRGRATDVETALIRIEARQG